MFRYVVHIYGGVHLSPESPEANVKGKMVRMAELQVFNNY